MNLDNKVVDESSKRVRTPIIRSNSFDNLNTLVVPPSPRNHAISDANLNVLLSYNVTDTILQ